MSNFLSVPSDCQSEGLGVRVRSLRTNRYHQNQWLLDDKEGLSIDNMMLLTDKGSLLTEKKRIFRFYPPFLPSHVSNALHIGV